MVPFHVLIDRAKSNILSDEEEGKIMARYNPVLDALPTYPQQALNQRKEEVRAQGKKFTFFANIGLLLISVGISSPDNFL